MKKIYVHPVQGKPTHCVVVFGNQEGSSSFPLPGSHAWEPQDSARMDGYYLVYGQQSEHWRKATDLELDYVARCRLFKQACSDNEQPCSVY